MASRFWVGGSGTWDTSTTTHWAATSGGVGGVSVPTSSDDVTFDTLSNATAYTVTCSGVLNANNLVLGNPLVGAMTFNSDTSLSQVKIFGNVNFASGLITNFSGTYIFSATSGTKTITNNSVVLAGNVTFSGVGGGWQLVDALNIGVKSITLTSGNFDTNSQAVTNGSTTINGSGLACGLTLGSTVWSSRGWLVGTAVNLTLDAGTSAITITNNGSFNGSSTLHWYDVTLSAFSATSSIDGGFYHNLTATIAAFNKTSFFQVGGDTTVSNLLTLTGYSDIARIFICRNTTPTGIISTITSASNAITYADFQDITGAGAASWDLHAITGNSGDCGGNSGITFTAAVDQHWQNASSSSWSTIGNWTSRVPLPQDNVFMDKAFGTSQTVTMDMPRMGKNIDWTGATWTTALTWTMGLNAQMFGNLVLISGLTTSGGFLLNMSARSATTITSNTATIGALGLQINCPLNTVTLADNLTLSGSSGLVMAAGTFDSSTFSPTMTIFGFSGAQVAKTITMGSGTWFLTASGSIWTTTSVLTITPQTSTIKSTNTSASAVTFAGGGKTYNNIWFSRGTSAASITLTGSNVFNDFKDDGSAAHSLLFTTATTTTWNSLHLSKNGAGNEITINTAASLTTTHTLSQAHGGIDADFLNIQHSVATGGASWYAGASSINNQATATAGSGWVFAVAPSFVDVSDSVTVSEAIQISYSLPSPKFESVTVSENLQIFESLPLEFESVTISENLQIFVSVPLIFESITVSESIQISLSLPSPIVDSVTVSESLQIFESLPLIFDSVTVSEAIQLNYSLPSPIIDSVTVSENITLLIPKLFISVFDNITTSEDIVVFVLTPYAVNLLELVTISENITLLIPKLFLSPFESITISESIQLSYTLPNPEFDSVTVSESIQISYSLPSPIVELVTVSENLQIFESLPLVFDSITVSETLAINYSLPTPIVDSITVSESVTLLIPKLFISVFDSATIAENTGFNESDPILFFENITVTENVKINISVFFINVGEDIQVDDNDGSSIQIILDVSPIETVTVSEWTSSSPILRRRSFPGAPRGSTFASQGLEGGGSFK